jgi:AAHS family 4-hydroxybenzoate transporter-like MFS transporter
LPAQQAKQIDVERFMNEQSFSNYHWLVFAMCVAVVILDGFDTAAIGFIAPSLVSDWNVAKPDLAPVLSAALFGLAGGALCAGPLADRFGRKTVLIAAIIVMGAASLLAATSGNLTTLTIWRFLTGLGLGAAMPNSVTLMSEYCPIRMRALVTNAMFCGFPLGAAFGGFLAAWMIPQFGWRSVLLLGGVAPLTLAAIALALLPESARYMVAHNYPVERIRAVMQKLSHSASDATSFVLHEHEPPSPAVADKSGLALILSRQFIVGSVMLWIAYFMGLVIFYGLINWMPLLLKETGLSGQQATLISALFPLGGIGAVYFGWLMDRHNANLVIVIGYLLTALSVYLVGQATGALLIVAVFIAGVVMNTAQSSLPALAAAFYPTRGRASGVSWMLGIGRFGGIAGSFLVAELTRRQMGLSEIFLVVAIPAVISAAALMIKQFVHPHAGAQPVAKDLPAH